MKRKPFLITPERLDWVRWENFIKIKTGITWPIEQEKKVEDTAHVVNEAEKLKSITTSQEEEDDYEKDTSINDSHRVYGRRLPRFRNRNNT